MRSTSAQIIRFVATALLAGWLAGPYASAPGGDAVPAARAFPLRFEARGDGTFVADAIGGRIEVAGDRLSVGGIGLTLRGPDAATLAGGERAQAPTRVFTESEGGMAVREIETYRTLRARGIAPGVDAVVSGTAGRVDLRLEIAAGAAASTVVLETSGDGSWILGTPLSRVSGDPSLPAPAVRLVPDAASGLALALPAGDGEALRIEVPIWRAAAVSTLDPARAGPRIALDADAGAYVASHVPPCSDDSSDAGDVLVAKLDREGRDYLWASYLTGVADAAPGAIAADARGRVAVAGRGFLALLDGVTGLVSAHVALEPSCDVRAIAFDGGGDVWIGGAEGERGVVARIGADGAVRLRIAPASPVEAVAIRDARVVIARTSPSGSVLDVLSPDGGVVASAAIDVRVASLAIDRSGRTVVAGSAGADVVLAAIDPESAAVTTLQVLEGPGADAAAAMTLDPQGRILVAGRTQGGIVPDPAPARAARGGAEGFAAVYDASGTDLLYGTYLGGSEDDAAASIAVDGNGRLWVAGSTVSTDTRDDEATWPLAGGASGFVAVLDLPAPARPSGVCPGTANFDGGGATDAWDDALNWDVDTVPDGDDDVCISGTFAVTVPSGSQSAGTLRVEGGASLTIGGGTLTIAGTSEIDGPLTLNSGILTGSGNITTASTFDFNAGTLSGTGTLTANAGLTLGTAGFRFLSRNLLVPAGQTLTYSGTGGMAINAATLTNAGTWDHQSNVTLQGTGLIVNSGTFNRTTSAGLVTLIVDFNNTGSVDVQTGQLSLSGDGTDTGDYDATGALLRFSGGTRTMSATTTITGDDVEITNGTYTFDGTYDVAGTTSMDFGSFTFTPTSTIASIGAVIDISAGTLTFDSGDVVAPGAVVHFAGIITGSDAITVSGIYAFDGGTMSGSGTTTAAGGANFGSGAFRTMSRSFIVPAGQTAIYSGAGGMAVNSPATLTNAGTWEHESDAGLSGSGRIVNTGAFRRVAGSGVMTVGALFDNTGTLEVATGTVHLANCTQDAGTTRLAGGNLSTGATPVRILGGTLTGSGTVTGHVAIGTASPPSGTVVPGLSAGAIAVTGTTTFAAGGAYACEIGGLTAGTQHDLLGGPASGAFALGGALEVSLIDGFTPAAGDTFTIVQGSARTGTFTATSLPPLGGGNVWNLIYTPTTAVLSVGPPVGADLSVTHADAPDPVNAGGTVTYTLTVESSGPDTATAVTLTDALDPTTGFVSATPSQGTCAHAAGTVTCSLGDLADGASATVTITVDTSAGSVPSITSTASVAAAEADLDPSNNSASATTAVDPSADLSVTKTDAPDPASTSTTLTYIVTVSNAGPSAATSLVAIDALPTGVTLQSATGTGWSCSDDALVVTCTRATLAAGASSPITIVVTTPPTSGLISNGVSVGAAEADPVAENNAAAAQTSISLIAADLSIVKSDSADPVGAGAPLTYTIEVANAGPDPATTVTVTDTLPAGVAVDTASGTGWICGVTGNVVTCTRSGLAVEAAPPITIAVTAPVDGGLLSNTATVSSPEADNETGDNTDTETTTVTARADLAIAKGDAPDPVAASGTLTYTLDVSNAGPSTATSVTVTDTLPAGAAFVSATSAGFTCGQLDGVVTCTRAALAVGSPQTITIVVTAPASPGQITNTATVAGAEPDPATTDNAATATTNVTAVADLTIAKSDGPDPVDAGQNLTYAIDVSNAGPSTANAVTVTDPLPAGSTFVSATGTGWTCVHAAGTVTCTRPTLAVGAAPTITIVVTPDVAGGTATNTATLTASEFDPTSPNTSTTTTTVVPLADVAIDKSDNFDPVNLGAPLYFNLEVRNLGPSPALNVTVTDTLPASLTFVSVQSLQMTCAEAAGTVTCTQASLAPGAVSNILLTTTAPGSAQEISNTATVATTTSDPIAGNDSDTETATVRTVTADLSITKVDTADPVDTGAAVTYAVTVSNAGPDAATGVTVVDVLPPGATFVVADTIDGWSFDLSTPGTVTGFRPTLASGASSSFTIQVTAPSTAGDLVNTATVTGLTTDDNLADNTATATTTVIEPAADVSITKAATSPTVGVGSTLTWEITVRNLGPSAATEVVMTDLLPAGVSFISASGSGWTCVEGIPVTCTRPSLAAGSASPITLTATAPQIPGTIVNTATIEAGVNDPVTSNNTGQATIEAIVETACGSLEDLLEAIGDADLDPTLQRTLEAPVRAAIGLERAGQLGAAAAKLGLFQQHCSAAAASGRIDADDAAELLECASSLRSGILGAAPAVKAGGVGKPATPARRR